MATATYALEIDWNNDGTYGHARANVFGDVGQQFSLTCTRGRDYASMLHGRTISGMLSATLLDPHHIYDPDNPGSPLYGLIRPQLLVRLRMQTAASLVVNAWHTLWTGYLDNIERQDVAAGSDQEIGRAHV